MVNYIGAKKRQEKQDKMPKGKTQVLHTNTPQNGRRAIAGNWGIKGKIKNSDIKEKNKQFYVLNNMCLQKYAINNIQKIDNIQVEMKK